jgi:phosphate/sulfate permease
VTTIDEAGSVASTATTAVLVLAASNCGLPVSTTHVSSSAIVGTGLRKRFKGHVCEACGTAVCLCTDIGAQPGHAVHWSVVHNMMLSWVVTLPAAGVIGAVVYLIYLGVERFI